MSVRPRPGLRTAAGTNSGPFTPAEWTMLLFNTTVWGASFLLIAIGLDGFTPGMVAWLRIVLGAGALALVPTARRSIDRTDWGAVAVVSVAGNAGPALLFAFAEQTVESSVAGMLNAAVPVATAGIAFALGQRSLRRVHMVGLLGGLAGVVLLSIPSVTGASPAAPGVAMVLLAVLGYSVTGNVLVPLAQKYGGLPVVMWAQTLGIALLAPLGLIDLGANRITPAPLIAVLVLGILSTGIARTVQAVMAGRVGAARASIVGYLVPVVALVLGVVFRGDAVAVLELVGLGVVLVSAFLATRATHTSPAH